MRHIILCADDYGQNKSICEGILALLNKSRLSAVSCLTNFPCWKTYGKLLQPFQSMIDIGLHLNLTEGLPLSMKRFSRLFQLIIQTYLHRINRFSIYQEIAQQLDTFIEVTGQLPDFIDGHQHIHQLPIIRDIILEIYQKRGFKCYFRSTYNSSSFIDKFSLKEIYIQSLLSKSFKSFLLSRSIPHNSSFAGIYQFGSKGSYRNLFSCFLKHITDGGLIMCHPGYFDQTDRIARSRQSEFDYFISEHFINDLRHSEVSLASARNLYTPD